MQITVILILITLAAYFFSYFRSLRKYTGTVIYFAGVIFAWLFIIGLIIGINAEYGIGWTLFALITGIGIVVVPLIGQLQNHGIGAAAFFLVNLILNYVLIQGNMVAGAYISSANNNPKNKVSILVTAILGLNIILEILGYYAVKLGLISS